MSRCEKINIGISYQSYLTKTCKQVIIYQKIKKKTVIIFKTSNFLVK